MFKEKKKIENFIKNYFKLKKKKKKYQNMLVLNMLKIRCLDLFQEYRG